VPLVLGGVRVGWLRRHTLEQLLRWPEHFTVESGRVTWIRAPAEFAARTAVLDNVFAHLAEDGVINHPHGERYPLTASTRERACCVIDRACAPFLGARAFGQHLNGYVRTARGIEMWIGRRAADRHHYPLHLDNLVAGGLPYGLSLVDNLRKECAEEAGIPSALVDQAVVVGAITYCRDSVGGLKPDVMYCYDLELPQEFVPVCTDGEVESFQRLPLAEVATLVRDTEAFKLNCNLTIIDFLVRHGFITPEEPEYLEILTGLRSPLP
jgi:8-oxo-dGTP pyrophosphatase MutT (NUDIX family)